MEDQHEYAAIVERAFDAAENEQSKVTPALLKMEGMTGKLTRHFYNALIGGFGADARYLEVGVWKGSSLCSAMAGNQARVVAIDNFSEFNGPRETFLANLATYRGDNDVLFLEQDCFTVTKDQLPWNFNVFLYDGQHDEQAQYKALTHFYTSLDDVFVFIVDDWNWQQVRKGTMGAIGQLGLKVLYKKEIRLTWNDQHTPVTLARDTWHNGIFVSVLQKKK